MIDRSTIFRFALLVALGLCSASLADAVLFGHAFCGFHSDCAEVAASRFARPLGVPIPAIGVAGFAIIFLFSLVPNRRAVFVGRAGTVAAGLIGCGLIAVQLFVLEKVCVLCMFADACGLVVAGVAIVLPAMPVRPRCEGLRIIGWIAAGLMAVSLPIGWAWWTSDPPTPPQVVAHWRPGTINIVELTDFDCPHCARFERVLREALRDADNYHLVRIPAPMPKHENARPAAKAFLAAERQGKGEEMASLLFAAKSRTPAECRELALTLRLDIKEFDRVVADPARDLELDETIAWAQRAGPGLPMLWIQSRFFPKMPSVGKIKRALSQVEPFEPRGGSIQQ